MDAGCILPPWPTERKQNAKHHAPREPEQGQGGTQTDLRDTGQPQ